MATKDIAGELLKLCTNHLAKQMNNNETKNVTFIFNEDPTNKDKISVTLTANRGLLSLLSPVFRKMFSNGMKESLDDNAIEIKDVDSQSFESFIQYFYMRPQIKASNVAVLSYLADKYLVDGLQKSCQLFMDKCVTLNNIVQIIESSLKYQQTKLVDQCQKWLEKVSEETPSNVIYALFESDICNDISVKAANVLLFSFGDSIDPQVLWKWIIKWNDANHDKDDEKQDNNNLDKLKAIATSFPFSSLSVNTLTNEVIPKKILSQEKIIDILSKKCEKYENSHKHKEYSPKIIPLKFREHNLKNYKICSAFGTTTIYRKEKVDEDKLSILYANIGMIEGNVYKWKMQIIPNSYSEVGVGMDKITNSRISSTAFPGKHKNNSYGFHHITYVDESGYYCNGTKKKKKQITSNVPFGATFEYNAIKATLTVATNDGDHYQFTQIDIKQTYYPSFKISDNDDAIVVTDISKF